MRLDRSVSQSAHRPSLRQGHGDRLADRHRRQVTPGATGEQPPVEYALEVDDVFVIVRFVDGGLEVDMPSDQRERWELMAERQGKTADEVVTAALDAAFSRL